MQYDIIIIGTGAGGGTLAHSIAGSGKNILILERGDFIPKEPENWNSDEVFLKNRYSTKEKWFDRKGKELTHLGRYCVGGSTKFFGGVMMRFRKSDFEEVQHYEGVSPSWPINYEDIEPYYVKAETLYKVHGLCRVDPTEPEFSVPYQYPKLEHEPLINELNVKLKNIGLNPFTLPLGLSTTREDIHQGSCIKCKHFDGFPCLLDAKSDAEVVCIRPILHYQNVTLITNAFVTYLETDNKGKIIKYVHANINGKHIRFSARIVVVSCGAINSAALLLRSANEFHPNGLANSSGVIGRYYMKHNNSVVICFSNRKNSTKFQKTLGINDFYLNSEYKYPLGHIQTLGKLNGVIMKSQASFLEKMIPSFLYEKISNYSVDFWVTSEDLPNKDNRISLDQNNNIVFNVTVNNLKPHLQLIAKLKTLLSKAVEGKLFYISKQIPILGTAHQCGTIRFGIDPKTSALDINCKAHDVSNLYVVDASFFVSSAAVNPSLTIAANAIRVGEYILSQMK